MAFMVFLLHTIGSSVQEYIESTRDTCYYLSLADCRPESKSALTLDEYSILQPALPGDPRLSRPCRLVEANVRRY